MLDVFVFMLSVVSLSKMINPFPPPARFHWLIAQNPGPSCHCLNRSSAHYKAYWKSQGTGKDLEEGICHISLQICIWINRKKRVYSSDTAHGFIMSRFQMSLWKDSLICMFRLFWKMRNRLCAILPSLSRSYHHTYFFVQCFVQLSSQWDWLRVVVFTHIISVSITCGPVVWWLKAQRENKHKDHLDSTYLLVWLFNHCCTLTLRISDGD